MIFLRPKTMAKRLGLSVTKTREFIGNSRCREKKRNDKTVFCYEDVVKFIQSCW